MRILITGAGGQLGRELQTALAAHSLRPLSHAELDITSASAVEDAIESFRPNAVVHAAALTDTGRCEREPELARAVNAAGAEHVAIACARAGAAMVYLSTNEVFDGRKTTGYLETDRPAPINHYGRSKVEGERAVQDALREHYIVRTAWLYGQGGNNFITKMLRAAEGGELTGVTDEIATPTWVRDLAGAISSLIETSRYGTYHFTNAGEASRHDWLCEILRLAAKPGVRVRPISTAEFRASLPADAVVPQKPPYSVLANTNAAALGITLRPWREALAEYFASA
jgi:dTDP-4-dehydrorhamnose reductase